MAQFEAKIHLADSTPPPSILAVDGSTWKERNLVNDRVVEQTVERDYVPIARIPHSHNMNGVEWLIVWRRKDLRPAGAPAPIARFG